MRMRPRRVLRAHPKVHACLDCDPWARLTWHGMNEEFPVPDELTVKDLLARISEERCSAPRCDRPAAAVVLRLEREVFVCAKHAEMAARHGVAVLQPGEDGVQVEPFVVERARLQRWEEKWARPGFRSDSGADSIPDEIRNAVEDDWFPPGGSVVDIGCGSGEIAAWLARQGYQVVGVDFAPSAIGRAMDAHGDVEGVTFDVVDISRQPPPGGPFDALVDRGCMQGISPQERPAYVRHVCAVAKAGAHFLLLHATPAARTGGPGFVARKVRELEGLLGNAFEIIDVKETVMVRRPATGETMPGVALWMVRRS
jgi:SAM-dependent methyltransferase